MKFYNIKNDKLFIILIINNLKMDDYIIKSLKLAKECLLNAFGSMEK